MHQVIVIGAGVSGLTAAWTLQQAGVHVRVLEARNRVGGRAWSPPIAGTPFDLGPTWVWANEQPVCALLDRLELVRRPETRSDALDTYETPTGLQRGRLPGSTVTEFRVEGGLGRLPDALRQRVSQLEPNRVVRAIHASSDGLAVELDDETLHADHVLCALPPRLLATTIDVPGAPLAEWSRVPTWMADVNKVVAIFDHAAWAPFSGRAFSTVGPMVEIRDLSGTNGPPALFGFVPREADSHDLEGRVREQLVRLFGPAAVPTHVVSQRWWTEPFTAIDHDAPTDPRSMGHPSLLKPALGGRLHLIGTETSSVGPGHLNGAVERAQTVARSLIANGARLA